MKLSGGSHLAYCTNVHAGETWKETFAALRTYTLAVKDRVAVDGRPFAIGLRLSDAASRELAADVELKQFRDWLDQNNCYVFTINGFPFGRFHNTRVKEQVYLPDWGSKERLEYTKRLFNILSILVPEGVQGSVSTLPGSFKGFGRSPSYIKAITENLRDCATYMDELAGDVNRDLHLGLEPEPFGLFETTPETVQFFDKLFEGQPDRMRARIGVNYDTCHLAVQFEEAAVSLAALEANKIRLSKLHLSSALAVDAGLDTRRQLERFEDEVYLHQVVARKDGAVSRRFPDLRDALAAPHADGEEWRVHFHIPLYAAPGAPFRDTRDHLTDALSWLEAHPGLCEHLEMETYTWSVLPEDLRPASVVDQLVREYAWVLARTR